MCAFLKVVKCSAFPPLNGEAAERGHRGNDGAEHEAHKHFHCEVIYSQALWQAVSLPGNQWNKKKERKKKTSYFLLLVFQWLRCKFSLTAHFGEAAEWAVCLAVSLFLFVRIWCCFVSCHLIIHDG